MIRRTGFLLFAAVLAACVPPAVSPGGGAGDAAAQRTVWERQQLDDYRFVLARECFCLGRGPVVVIVRDGRIAELRDPQSGQPAAQDAIVDPMTVDELFARIAQAQANGEHTEVEYHPALGYPTVAEIGTLANDAGIRYHVTELAPLD
ncbi:MAG TPA: DUF6174 domain-containing protein [Longimicrobium sp.]|nr:DUF6174 domain-containing protein [Longimicrobium sp.]